MEPDKIAKFFNESNVPTKPTWVARYRLDFYLLNFLPAPRELLSVPICPEGFAVDIKR